MFVSICYQTPTDDGVKARTIRHHGPREPSSRDLSLPLAGKARDVNVTGGHNFCVDMLSNPDLGSIAFRESPRAEEELRLPDSS
jgi:hypothetical protein